MSDLGQKLIGIVRAKAAETPDFVYSTPLVNQQDDPPCVYVYNGCPSCLIGHALFEAGVITPSLESQTGNSKAFGQLTDELGLELDGDEAYWLRMVQRSQDTHLPWGESVKRADKWTAERHNKWNVA